MFIKNSVIIACMSLLLVLAGCARKSSPEIEAINTPATSSPKPLRVSGENTDAAEPSVAPARDGTIYVAWVEHREKKEADVMLAHVDRQGRIEGVPVRVNPEPGAATAWRGDPPTVAVGADGAVFVGWTARVAAQGHANDLYLSTSHDGGKTFEQTIKVNDDGKKVAHAMHSLAVGADNRVYVVWLDERNVVMPPAPQNGKMEHMEANREVFFAASADGGRSFSANQRIGKEACPCCKTALAVGAGERVYASWRQVLPGEFRHIAVAGSVDGGKTFASPTIVSDDRWMTASCPVSGPAISTGGDGTLRVVWYTEGAKSAVGLYSAESRDGGKTFSESRPLAKGQARGNPVLLANERSGATVIWEGNEGGDSRVLSAALADSDSASVAPLTNSGELPSAAVSGDQLFVGYIAKINDRRGIWIVRAKPAV